MFRHATGLSVAPLPPNHDRTTKNVQTTTFGIGEVLFHTSATTDPKVYPGLDITGIAPLTVLWPIANYDIQWPISIGLTEQGADWLSIALEELLHSPKVFHLPPATE